MLSEALEIKINRVGDSRVSEIDFDNIIFGRQFSDHMFETDYSDGEWGAHRIGPYQPIMLSPSCLALHYGQTIFEGLKAYKHPNGEVKVFRPLDNFRRLNRSAVRMCMPEIDPELMLESLKQLLKLDSSWVPSKKDHLCISDPSCSRLTSTLG